MVPESVDERILEEHLLRDRFYQFDYNSIASSPFSSSASPQSGSVAALHGAVGFVLDCLVVLFIVALVLAAVYVVLRAIILTKRNHGKKVVLPVYTEKSAPSSSAANNGDIVRMYSDLAAAAVPVPAF
ncbi:uncharacterized protein V1518DRAFT_425080 [Limtongia smithiae]|uniref:uncharacterized protein n=1 Tax=Limtongia smithiae TaxID=1125753 RepID=UPI0034CDF905